MAAASGWLLFAKPQNSGWFSRIRRRDPRVFALLAGTSYNQRLTRCAPRLRLRCSVFALSLRSCGFGARGRRKCASPHRAADKLPPPAATSCSRVRYTKCRLVQEIHGSRRRACFFGLGFSTGHVFPDSECRTGGAIAFIGRGSIRLASFCEASKSAALCPESDDATRAYSHCSPAHRITSG